MNSDEVRGVFEAALSGPTPTSPSTTDDLVVAGRRTRRRRRIVQAGSSALAAIAAVAVVAAVTGIVSQATPPPRASDLDKEGSGTLASPDDEPDCPWVPDLEHGDVDPTAEMYNTALNEQVGAMNGNVGSYSAAGEEDHEFFYYNTEVCGYVFDEIANFSGQQSNTVRLFVAVYDPATGPLEERIEALAGCEDLDGTCRWAEDRSEGALLLVEEQRNVTFDEDEDEVPIIMPFRSALLGLEDGTIVHTRTTPLDPGGLPTSTEQLADIAVAIPVGETPEAADEPADYTIPSDADLIAAFQTAVGDAIPGAVLQPTEPGGSISFVDLGFDHGDHRGEDSTRIVTATLTMDGAESVEIFLQITPIDAPGDGPGKTAAYHYTKCGDSAQVEQTDCDYTELDSGTALVHRTVTSNSTEMTSVEFRSSDAWVFGVGVRSADGSSVEFGQLDEIVNAIG